MSRPDEPTRDDPEGDDLAVERALFNTDDDDFSLFTAAAVLGRVEGRPVDLDALDVAVDVLAALVKEHLRGGARWPAPLAALVEVLFRDRGFQGDTEEYDAPRNSFLDVVVQRRRGLPIALSVLTCEVARRAGIQAHGIAFPGHFLVGVRDATPGSVELVVLDPFHRGRLLSPKHLEAQLAQMTGQPVELSAEHIAPADPQAVLARMLQNLRGSYLRRQEPLPLCRVLSRLLVLKPGNPTLLVERAELRRELLDAEGAGRDAEAALGAAKDAAVAERAKRVLKVLADDARYVN